MTCDIEYRFNNDTKWDKCKITTWEEIYPSLSEEDKHVVSLMETHCTVKKPVFECHSDDCDNGGYCDLYPNENHVVEFALDLNEQFLYFGVRERAAQLQKEISSLEDLLLIETNNHMLAIKGRADKRQLTTWMKAHGYSMTVI